MLALTYASSALLAPVSLHQPAQHLRDLYYLLVSIPAAGVTSVLIAQTQAHHRTLSAQRAEIRTLYEDKSRFFRNISHELRTPLTMIVSPLAEELEHAPTRNVEVAHRNALRLHTLVNQLLELQTVTAATREVAVADLDLTAFTATFVDSYYPSGLPHGVKVDVRSPGPLFARAQIDGLETILFNYLSNAIKYSPPDSTVTLEVRATDGGPEISVRDEGPGIAEADLPRLFQEFSQVGDRADRREGTGLGLALVKRLATAMGARVGVESTLGAGCRFWVRLPPGEPTTTSWAPRAPPILAGEPRPDPYEPDHPAAPPSGDFLLVVEDQPDLREHVVELLRASQGVPVLGVPDGQAALDRMDHHPPRLVVTDWRMPRVTGPELIRKMRDDPRLASTPVVLLTASSDEESRLLGSSAGADVFLGKPFERAELISVVRNLLRLKEREKVVEQLNRQLREVVLRRFLPDSLVDAVVEGRVTFEDAPSTLAVTVLFADVVGFTPMTERLRPHRIAGFLREYLSAMSELVFEHGGTVDKYVGDGIMVLFGAPVAAPSEASCAAAVACARAMQRRIRELNASWSAQGIPEIRLRIGVHHGAAAVGWLGTQHRTEYTAVGPAVNQASRIEGLCEPGAIYVSAVVADYLPPDEVTSLGAFELRGIPTPQHLYRVRQDPPDHRPATSPAAQPGSPPRSLPSPVRVQPELQAGEVFERYRVLRRLDGGGMASVYEVRHEILDTRHALKVLHVADPGLRDRLVIEGRLQARLDPAHVVPVTDVIEVHGEPALVMPLVDGCALAKLLHRYRPTEDEALALFAGTVQGVAAAHAIGVVHRDLKPANVLLERTSDGLVPRVADFGIARVLGGPGHTEAGVFVGTPAYAAPEQLRDAHNVTPAADLWSLGVVLRNPIVAAPPPYKVGFPRV